LIVVCVPASIIGTSNIFAGIWLGRWEDQTRQRDPLSTLNLPAGALTQKLLAWRERLSHQGRLRLLVLYLIHCIYF
jgi:hypothetical protein